MKPIDECRIARKLWVFYASQHLKQPFVLWLDAIISLDAKRKAKEDAGKVPQCKPDSAAWDQIENGDSR